MLTIETDAEFATGGVVYRVVQGGEFEESELVEVYLAEDFSKFPIVAFQAHYIKFGYNMGEEPILG